MTDVTYEKGITGLTADYSDTEMHAAIEVNMPNYATAIVTTDQIVNVISAL